MPKSTVVGGSSQATKATEKRSAQKSGVDKGAPGDTRPQGKEAYAEGMLPRVRIKVPEERRKMVVDVAANVHPGKKSISELRPGQRERWIALACSLLYGDPEAEEEVDAANEAVKDAEIALRKKQVKKIERQRWKLQRKACKQLLRNEERREANGRRIEWLLMGMMVVGFTVALGLIVAAALANQSNPESTSFAGWAFAIGGSGATGLVSLVMLALHRTRMAGKDLELLLDLVPPTAITASVSEDPPPPASD